MEKSAPHIEVISGKNGSVFLRGIENLAFDTPGTLYKVAPLASKFADPILQGSIPNAPVEPVAWGTIYGENRARVFYTSLGHKEDFERPDFRKLLVNALVWGTADSVKRAEMRDFLPPTKNSAAEASKE
ncbi:MAG: hypothetical protein QM811_05550 [Pirellulales bacterium]